MKWFKVYGQEVMNSLDLQRLTRAQLGLWLQVMCIASIQKVPGQISVESLAKVWHFDGKTLGKCTANDGQMANFWQVTDGILHITNWSKFQSDYSLRLDRELKSSEILRSDNGKSVYKNKKIEREEDIIIHELLNSDPSKLKKPAWRLTALFIQNVSKSFGRSQGGRDKCYEAFNDMLANSSEENIARGIESAKAETPPWHVKPEEAPYQYKFMPKRKKKPNDGSAAREALRKHEEKMKARADEKS